MPVQKSNTLRNEERRPICPELDSALYRHLEIDPKRVDLKREKERIRNACAEDPFFFIFGGFVRTFDGKDRLNPIKLFPNDPYLYRALEFIHRESEVEAEIKSRQLVMTWTYAAYMVWDAYFHNFRHCFYQGKTATDSFDFTFNTDWTVSRCAFILYAMPEILWPPDDEVIKGMRGKIIFPWGSLIQALPLGAHQWRSHVASLGVIDEACFHPDFSDTYGAALEAVKGGGRLRVLSTPRYSHPFGVLTEAVSHLGQAA